jgi:hypothetical protein
VICNGLQLLSAWLAGWLQVYLILDEFILGGEFEETSKKVSSQRKSQCLSTTSMLEHTLR